VFVAPPIMARDVPGVEEASKMNPAEEVVLPPTSRS
jgi:hypothetical protein